MSGTALGTVALRQVAKAPRNERASDGHPEGEHRWGMVIDIDLCIGCNYCTYACQAINNLSDEMSYNIVTTETTENRR